MIWTNALPSTGGIRLGVERDFGVITDYFPICDNPNGVSAWGYRYDPHKPQIRYTWYDRYLRRRYEEMRRLANEEAQQAGPLDPCKTPSATERAIREDVHKIDRYAIAFFDRYLRNRRYYYGSETQRE